MDATGTAFAVVSAMLITLPAGIIGGKMADKLNKKMIIVYCDLVSIVFYIVCAFIPFTWFSLVLIVIASIFQNMEGPAYYALVVDLNKTEDRDRAFSLGYLGMNLGLIASPTIAGFLLNKAMWLIFLISGVSIAISTALIFFLIKDIKPSEDTSAAAVYQKARDGESVFKVLKSMPVVLIFILAQVLYYGAYNMYGYLMPLDLARVHGEDGALIYGTVSSLNCIVVVVFTAVLTKMFSKWRAPKRSFLGYLLVLTGYMIYLFLGLTIKKPIFYYAGIVVFTWGEILTTIAEGPFIANRVPESHRGRIEGVQTVLHTVFQTGMYLAVGAVYDAQTDEKLGSTWAWVFVFGVLAVALVCIALTVFLDRKKYPKLYEKRSNEMTEEEKAELSKTEGMEKTASGQYLE